VVLAGTIAARGLGDMVSKYTSEVAREGDIYTSDCGYLLLATSNCRT